MSKKGRPRKHDGPWKFKPGHQCLFKREVTKDEKEAKLQSNSPYSQRLTPDDFRRAVHDSPDGRSYVVTDVAGNPGNMRFLRPMQEVSQKPDLPKERKSEVIGNKILHTGLLITMFNECMHVHKNLSPDCEGSFQWNSDACQKWGLGWRMGLKCDSCEFKSKKYNLYEEQQMTEGPKRGGKAAKMNLGLQIGLMTTSVGIEGVRGVMLAAGVPMPAKNSMQKCANKVGDAIVATSEADMRERRKKLQELNLIRGFDPNTPIGLAGDGRYNNSIGDEEITPGQGATQMTYHFTETETPFKDIVGLYTGNKHCKTREYYSAKWQKAVECPNHPGTCTANLKQTDVIGDEFRAAEQCVTGMVEKDSQKINIGYLTTDGDSRACDGAQAAQSKYSSTIIENLRDTRHFSQSHKKAIRKVKFSARMFPGPTKADKEKQHRQFAIDIKSRCHREYNKAHKKLAGDMKKLVNKLSYTADAIVDCVDRKCGDKCRKHSFICSGGKKNYWKTSYLPPSTKICMTSEDRDKLREVVMKRLGLDAIRKTRLNTNTQKTEAAHRGNSKTNPKNITWYRHFKSRIHMEATILNCGIDQAIIMNCEACGVSICDKKTVMEQLHSMEKLRKMHAAIKLTKKYLNRKEYLRKLRFALYEKGKKVKKITYRKCVLDPEMFTQKSVKDHTYGKVQTRKVRVLPCTK